MRLEGDLGDKLFKVKNLALLGLGTRPSREAQPEQKPGKTVPAPPPAPARFTRPSDPVRADSTSIMICGSWNEWRPQAMTFEPQRRCHKFQVMLSSSSSESPLAFKSLC